MNMNIKTIALAAVLGVGLLSSIFGHAGSNNEQDIANESPVELYVAPQFECFSGGNCVNFYNWTITALDNDVVIKDFVVNRGNCKPRIGMGDRYRTQRLNYSDVLEFRVISNDTMSKCNPLEAKVVTNKGTWTFDMR